MPAELSTTALASAFAEHTDEVWLVLLTIEHDDLEAAIRLVCNTENIVSRSETFVALPFELELPSETPDGIGEARLRVDNVDRGIVDALRTISGPPTVTIEVILADEPDTLEIQLPNLTLRNATYDVNVVEGVLRFEDIVAEPVAETITPERFPGLF